MAGAITVLGEQLHHLIETAARGLQCLLGHLGPASLNVGHQRLEAIPEPMLQIGRLLRRVGGDGAESMTVLTASRRVGVVTAGGNPWVRISCATCC